MALFADLSQFQNHIAAAESGSNLHFCKIISADHQIFPKSTIDHTGTLAIEVLDGLVGQ